MGWGVQIELREDVARLRVARSKKMKKAISSLKKAKSSKMKIAKFSSKVDILKQASKCTIFYNIQKGQMATLARLRTDIVTEHTH